tara:strand:- start:540 stop:1139 length:600 start_codon:yes stop_codon:yes gene_type:complete
MVDIREIMQDKNARLERLLEKIAMGGKGVYSATNTLIKETIDRLSNTEMPTEKQVSTTSRILTTIILEGFNQYRKRDIKAEMEEDIKNLDMDAEDAPDDIIPDSVISTTSDKALEMVAEELNLPPEIMKELTAVLASSAGRNYTTWVLLLVISYLIDEAPKLQEADDRKEVTEIKVPEDTDFSDEFKDLNKSWFRQLRK